jgi:hypothetical protein
MTTKGVKRIFGKGKVPSRKLPVLTIPRRSSSSSCTQVFVDLRDVSAQIF